MADTPTLTGTFKALNTDGQRFLPEGERRSRTQRILDEAAAAEATRIATAIDKEVAAELGQPDRMADQIDDSILERALASLPERETEGCSPLLTNRDTGDEDEFGKS